MSHLQPVPQIHACDPRPFDAASQQPFTGLHPKTNPSRLIFVPAHAGTTAPARKGGRAAGGFGIAAGALPATVDGYTLPHVDNVPNGGWEDEYFHAFEPGANITAPGKVSIYHFSVNFNTPANSTFDFKHPEVIEVAPFVDDVCGSMGTDCIEAPHILDSMAYVPNVRFVFRSFFKSDGQGEAFLLGSFPIRASKAGRAWPVIASAHPSRWNCRHPTAASTSPPSAKG